MSFEVLDAEQVAIRAIRSYLGTLDRYRLTSMAVHNRHIESVSQLARDLDGMVNFIAEDFGDSSQVKRWVAKFNEYVTQYDLVPKRTEGATDGKAKEGGREVQPNIGPNRPDAKT